MKRQLMRAIGTIESAHRPEGPGNLPSKDGLVFKLKLGGSSLARVPVPRMLRSGFTPACPATYHSAVAERGQRVEEKTIRRPVTNLQHVHLKLTMA